MTSPIAPTALAAAPSQAEAQPAERQKKLEHAAKQFEAALLRTMLKSMEKMMSGKSSGSSMYASMRVGALADALGDAGGIGLAKTLSEQIRREESLTEKSAQAPLEPAVQAVKGGSVSQPSTTQNGSRSER